MSMESPLKNESHPTPVAIEMVDLEKLEEARRAKIEREKRLEGIRAAVRGFFLTLTVCICLFGGFLGIRYALTLPYFSFSRLVVLGDLSKVPPERIKTALDPLLTGNYFSTDLQPLREALMQVPWIKSVSVRRVWPNALEVQFTTREAIATYEDGRLVDEDSQLFVGNYDEQDNRGEALPNFHGMAGQIPEMAYLYREFSRAVQPLGVKITDIYCSDRGSWSISVSGGSIPPTRIDLGQNRAGGEGVLDKLVNVVAAYPHIRELMDGPPRSIDARYNRAFSASLPDKEHQGQPLEDSDAEEETPTSAP